MHAATCLKAVGQKEDEGLEEILSLGYIVLAEWCVEAFAFSKATQKHCNCAEKGIPQASRYFVMPSSALPLDNKSCLSFREGNNDEHKGS